MGKLLFLLLIGTAIYFLFIKQKPLEKKEKEDENEFVQCEKCGTFVLKKEMKQKDGKLLCKDCYADS